MQDAIIRGNITIKDKASLWFATIVSSLPGGNIFIGEGSNIQDNTIIDSGEKSLVIGKKVTVGHNVRLGACSIGDNCLIGMGCTIEDDVVIEEDAFVGARAIVKTYGFSVKQFDDALNTIDSLYSPGWKPLSTEELVKQILSRIDNKYEQATTD